MNATLRIIFLFLIIFAAINSSVEEEPFDAKATESPRTLNALMNSSAIFSNGPLS